MEINKYILPSTICFNVGQYLHKPTVLTSFFGSDNSSALTKENVMPKNVQFCHTKVSNIKLLFVD